MTADPYRDVLDRLVTAVETLNQLDTRRAEQIGELRRAVDAITESMATRYDLDDIRLEMREAAAMPFDQRNVDAEAR